MFWSEIAKKIFSSEVGYDLCTLVSNNVHHVKYMKELFTIIIFHRRLVVIFLPEKFMQCLNVRVLKSGYKHIQIA